MMVWRVAPGAAFVLLLALVAGRWAPLSTADRAASARALAFGDDHPAWVATMRWVTDAGATPVFLAAGIALTVVLLLRQRYRQATATALVTALVPVLWGVLHQVLHRLRPVGGFVVLASNGFPSGHTANATALALLAVFLLWNTRGRAVVVICAAAFAALIGLTRIALLAHWPSDVVGGWLLALTVVPLVMCAPGLRASTVGRCEGHGDPPVRRA